jgi:hypothetical protein
VKYLEAFLTTNPEFEVDAETRALVAAIQGVKADPDPADD